MDTIIKCVDMMANIPTSKLLNIISALLIAFFCHSDIPTVCYMLKISMYYFVISAVTKNAYAVIVYVIRSIYYEIEGVKETEGYIDLSVYYQKAIADCDSFKLEMAKNKLKSIDEDNNFSQNVIMLGEILILGYMEHNDIISCLEISWLFLYTFVFIYFILLIIACKNLWQYSKYDYKIPENTNPESPKTTRR